jgi:hypothetical protein
VRPLSSPGTDELGRAGLSGEVNRHFFDRFGAAILLTVINGAVQAAVNAQTQNGSVVVSPSATSDVMSEVLRGTINIRPTITKAQGDRIQVFAARDVDFRPVYALKVANLAPGETTPLAAHLQNYSRPRRWSSICVRSARCSMTRRSRSSVSIGRARLL